MKNHDIPWALVVLLFSWLAFKSGHKAGVHSENERMNTVIYRVMQDNVQTIDYAYDKGFTACQEQF